MTPHHANLPDGAGANRRNIPVPSGSGSRTRNGSLEVHREVSDQHQPAPPGDRRRAGALCGLRIGSDGRMAIEDLLREAAAKGMTHLTLYPVDSADGKTVYWNARATPSTMHSYVQTANYDPVVALTTALEALPRAPKRKAKVPASEKEITAAVSPGDPVDLHDGPNDEWSRFRT